MSYRTEHPEAYKRIKELDDIELYKHALVSLNNNHYCIDCYCCSCLDEMNERKSKRRNVIKQRRENP